MTTKEPVKSMLSSANLGEYLDVNGNPTWERILDPAYQGSVCLTELMGLRTYKDFESITELSRKELIAALQRIHPNKSVSVTRELRKRDKYALEGRLFNRTVFKIEINKLM